MRYFSLCFLLFKKPTFISYIGYCKNRPSIMMLLLFLAIYLRTSFGLLLTTANRVPTRNITCRHGLPSTKIDLLFNCEACLITSRNYYIETALSLTGAGPTDVSYACLHVKDVEGYHANLVRECRYFPKDTLNGYDDFCIASPYNIVRGSYRACICITNACNFNYSQCIRKTYPNRNPQVPSFSNTVVELTNRVKCYRPYEDFHQVTYSNLIPLCSNNDDICKDYIFDHGVLCAISVDRTNQIARQTLPPSLYTEYIIKYKTKICNAFTDTSKSIYFSQCELEDTVCMCTVDECDKDLETCRTSGGVYKNFYSIYFLFVVILNA